MTPGPAVTPGWSPNNIPARPASPGPRGSAPRLVRPYTVTGGRTRSLGTDLPMETLVSANERGRVLVGGLRFERADVVGLCRDIQSVAEVSARLRLPLGVARVLVGDLHAEGLLDIHKPVSDQAGPDAVLLGKVLDGLQAI